MDDSRKRMILTVVLLLVIACLFWFFRSAPKPQPRAAELPASHVKETPAVKPQEKPADTNTAVQKTPIVPIPLPATNQPVRTASVPALELITGDNSAAETNVFPEPYIKRCRAININPEALEKNGKLVEGSRLNLALFEDAKYAVTLQQVNRSPQGDFSVSGKLDGEEYGTFTLSSASGVVIMRLADPAAKRLYLIRCHGPEKTHYVVEIDPAKVPVPKHGAPNPSFQK